jgi:hypothetical protein
MTAKFLADRVWGTKPFPIKLVHCRDCGFAFYYPRLTDKELAALYQNYRDAVYQRQRYLHEPEYTEEYNARIGNSLPEIVNRKQNLVQLLARNNIKANTIRNVLDFSGDKGQFIPDELVHADRYVYEISGVAPLPGIKLIRDLSESRGRKFDLIMCCHVLEHVVDPVTIIEQLKRFAHGATVFYFELPNDSPYHWPNSKLAHGLLLRNEKLYKLYFWLRGLIKRQPNPYFEMHEHINYFSPRALTRLLERRGLFPTQIEARKIDHGWIKRGALYCLARMK